MKKYWFNVTLSRIIFPGILIGCTIWRPVGMSLVYLILALVSPLVPVPTNKSMNGRSGLYFKISIGLCFIMSITQLCFHIALLSLPPYGHFLHNCHFLEKLLRHIGLVRLDEVTLWEVFFWIIPEIVVLPSSILIYVLCRRITNLEPREDIDTASLLRLQKKNKERNAKIINFLGHFGTYVVLVTLCCTASLKPSVEGALYFVAFIGSATWWAFHRELRHGFAIICRFLMLVVVVHIVVLLSYQNQWPQEYLPVNSTWARYFGLIAIYETNCTDPRYIKYIPQSDWSRYDYSIRLFILYFTLALQSKFLFKKPAKEIMHLSGKLDTLDTPLSRHVSIRKRTASQRWQSARRKARKPTVESQPSRPNERTPLMRFGSGRTGLLQDSIGSVIVQDGQTDENIQLQSLSEDPTEEKPGILENVIMAVFSIFQLIVNSSYLATNIIMMTWSIMYHSWTTFALLLWALVLWMVPNKRASMMKCSPFIAFYSTVLLLIQYVYSMDLTEEELPTVIHGIKMSDIGFKKTSELSCWHLIVKSVFMAMFWITMRQYMTEKIRQRRTSNLRDMVAPLHVSVSTATTAMQSQSEPEIKSKFMKNVGLVIKKFLTKFWIAVVAVTLFASGITGERMTVFRIIYMSLFLIFIITFQISWTLWRKMMYGFWITVIGYSVIMLILVYTYQFPDFPEYWEKYLFISKNLQEDIGLITYDTKDLFVRLLTPTFFVIITVIQIHYFHHDFLQVTNLTTDLDSVERPMQDNADNSPSTAPIISSTRDYTLDDSTESRVYTLKKLKHMSKMERRAFLKNLSKHLYKLYNYIWLFLEIHMEKIVFISFVLLCIHDVCAIHFIFILIVAISINIRINAQIRVINAMAAAVAVLIVIKMLYQIDYIKHEDWDRNCTEHVKGNSTHNDTVIVKTYNMAEWFGLKKLDVNVRLPRLLDGYISIITVTTVESIVALRQWFYRCKRGMPLETPLVMFPKIQRSDADNGLIPCCKFLLNYGFYKFGLEFCLMGIVALIGTRLDFYSILYSIWLMLLFSLHRKTISKLWPFFKIFAIVLLPLQYALVIAPPTWLCIDYPWKYSETLRELQVWMYLPDPDSRPNPRKLMCDFILLLMIVRQSFVFGIEQRCLSSGQNYPAGHNYSVYRDMDKPNFVNPIKDYVSHIYNWLDVFKRGTMMSLMWITLSIMFLAGTKRTNLFSLGYLIGSFVFLWQGSDFYLRPVHTILKWWNILIGYNIFVIFCKTIFQGIGCVFIQKLEFYACWLIQLLGIACLKKFEVEQFKSSSTCEVDREDIGMVWDGLCFGFLLMQKRLFRSYYFFHIIDETKAMSILASRGAELLEELHQKRILAQENFEKTVFQKIKHKMDKIKENQRKIHGPTYNERISHKIGVAPLAGSSSMSSCMSSTHTPPQGYQTPIDDDEDELRAFNSRTASLHQVPSPHSAVMTVSLEAYLEPNRISFGSPPSSDLNARGPSPDDTFAVFSPPPFGRPRYAGDATEDKVDDQGNRSSHADISWSNALRTPRRSITSSTSRSHQTYSLYKRLDRPLYRHETPKTHVQAVRSGDYYMFDDMDDDDLTDLLPEKDILETDIPERTKSKMTIGELMNTVLKTDIETATQIARFGGTAKDAMKLRRRSLPLTRKKSSMSYLSARSETGIASAADLRHRSPETPADEATSEPDEDADSRQSSRKQKKEASKDKDEGSESKMPISTYFRFIWVFINSTMVSMTKYLNKYSNDYRYVRKVLAKEKKLLKAKPDFRMGTRLGINQIWQPLPILNRSSIATFFTEDRNDEPSERTSIRFDLRKSSIFPHVLQHLDKDETEAVLSEVDQPPIIQLAASIWFGVLAHSTFLCYFMVFLHQIKNASILSTPLPLMVFLWGSLTIPRPSRTFWVTLIAYVEIIVIVKCICQPAFLSWNQKEMSSYPFEVPRIIGVERTPNYALWDLLLLLVVFFHRFMLKSLGQWTTPVMKLRSTIAPGYTLATVREPNLDNSMSVNKGGEEGFEGQASSAEPNELRTPKGLILHLHANDDNERGFDLPASIDNERVVVIQATERNIIDENFEKAMSVTVRKYVEPMRMFFMDILDPYGKEKVNVYAYMFLCDFFNFILLIFGFSAFGAQQGDGGVATYFAENRVPMPFLLMLLLQFALIVIDRALFLKKSSAGKLIFQYCLVIGVHIWMFIILPSATERQFNTKVIPQIWYMVKCFYLLLAAYQLRLGYPTRILGNFLCKKYTIINFVLFKGFMLIPFLFEMRAVMDWIWTDTSMTVMDWFKMEDIFANIYQIKCMRGLESDYPQPRGVKKAQISKYLVGGVALFLMIGMIWFPLLLFALGSAVGISNLPYEVSLTVNIGSYESIYKSSAQNSSIFEYNVKDFSDLKELYEAKYRDRAAVTFLENYVYTDVAVVKMSPGSGSVWSISPPDRDRLISELMSSDTVSIHVEWKISRKPASKDSPAVTSNTREILLEPYVNDTINPVRKQLIQMIRGYSEIDSYDTPYDYQANPLPDTLMNRLKQRTNASVTIQHLLPMFLKVTSKTVNVVPQLIKPLVQNKNLLSLDVGHDESLDYLYREGTLYLMKDSDKEWYFIKETCNDSIYNVSLNNIPLNDCNYLTMFLFNDKIFPEGLSFISGLGIFGLYTTAVILVSSFIKKTVSDMAPKIMFEDLPYIDRILRLCLDIYLVRESGDLSLEEDLFAKLIFLYRSPETMIRWTRPPEPGEKIDGDEDENYNEINDHYNHDDEDDREDREDQENQDRARQEYEKETKNQERQEDQEDQNDRKDPEVREGQEDDQEYQADNNDDKLILRKRIKKSDTD